MATRTATARLLPRATTTSSSLSPFRPLPPRRSFFSLPAAEPQTLHARRLLPYGPAPLYDLIADIDTYPRFLPYCSHARVTSSTDPDPDTGRRWPTRADLSAGWGGLAETYSSRVFCVPDAGIVEAISGDARTEIGAAELRRWGLTDPGPSSSSLRGAGAPAAGEGVFKSLVTRWTVRSFAAGGGARGLDRDGIALREGEWSEVDLSIKFQFANPLYNAMSSAVADKVAPIMIEAFVKEARRVLGEPKRNT